MNLPVDPGAAPVPAHALAGRMRAARQAQGLSIREAARRLGCSPRFVHQLEQGKPTVRLDKVLQAAAGLGLCITIAGAEPGAADPERLARLQARTDQHMREDKLARAHERIAAKLALGEIGPPPLRARAGQKMGRAGNLQQVVRAALDGDPARTSPRHRHPDARHRAGGCPGAVPEHAFRISGARRAAPVNLGQLDQLLTAVAKKHRVDSFVVIGSLSVPGLVDERRIPDAMTVSTEVDAYPESDPARAFEIADDFGLGSAFEQEHGY